MFRFTNWMPPGHSWGRWIAWFDEAEIAWEIRNDGHGNTAVFREGREAITEEAEEHRRLAERRRANGE